MAHSGWTLPRLLTFIALWCCQEGVVGGPVSGTPVPSRCGQRRRRPPGWACPAPGQALARAVPLGRPPSRPLVGAGPPAGAAGCCFPPAWARAAPEPRWVLTWPLQRPPRPLSEESSFSELAAWALLPAGPRSSLGRPVRLGKSEPGPGVAQGSGLQDSRCLETGSPEQEAACSGMFVSWAAPGGGIQGS